MEEILVLIVCAIVYSAVRKSRQSAKKKDAPAPKGKPDAGFRKQMADLARDIAANDGDPVGALIDELRRSEAPAAQRSASSEGQPAAPAEQTMFEAAVAPEARVRPEAPSAQKAGLASGARLKAAAAAAPRPSAGAKAPAARRLEDLPSGASATDSEGCVGGSLGAHREEGESRAEHEAHNRARAAAIAAERTAARRAAAARRANVDQLRQAVVMSEILDRPKALRRRESARL